MEADSMEKPQIVKTTTLTYDVLDVGLDFLTYDERFRAIRKRVGGPQFAECFVCGKHFADGEMISLMITNRGNKAVCRACGTKLQEQLKGDV